MPIFLKKIYSKIVYFLNRLRKRFVYKIFLSYVSIFTGLLILLIIASSFQMSKRELSQTTYSGTNVLNQTAAYIQYRVQEITGIVSVVAYSDNVKQALIDGENYYSYSSADWNIQTSHGIKKISYGSYISHDISEIRLYAPSGDLSFEATDYFQNLSTQYQDEWRKRVNLDAKNTTWIPSTFFADSMTTPAILLVTRVASMDNIKKYLGYIVSTIPESTFSQIANQASVTQNTSLLLYNTEKEVIIKNDSCMPTLNPDAILSLTEKYQLNTSEELKTVNFEGTSYLMGIRSMDKTDWTLAMLIPYNDILENNKLFIRQLIFQILILLLFCLPVIYFIGHSLTSRIVRLQNLMTTFKEEDPVTPINNGNDEIGELTNSFYHMQCHIQTLLKEQYERGIAIKDLELQLLQAQINPHFLYNTLDMLYWMGIRHEAPDISNIAQKLGQFYKLSLGNGEKIVTLEDELKHIEAYIDIQNMRFNRTISFQNDVPLSLYPYQIIKVTLQPLIENAINHGIREKVTECGTIYLNGYIKEQDLFITIRDDGVGMNEEQLSHILEKRNHSSGHGYGVWNINERIQLTFGKSYGLQYESQPGIGTCVTIKIPSKLMH